MQSGIATVGDPQGLHAQLAHELVRVAAGFTASIWIRYDGRRASLREPIQLLTLRAPAGAQVSLLADGLDETEALAAVGAALQASAR